MKKILSALLLLTSLSQPLMHAASLKHMQQPKQCMTPCQRINEKKASNPKAQPHEALRKAPIAREPNRVWGGGGLVALVAVFIGLLFSEFKNIH